MSQLPEEIDDTTGAIYVVTHAREFNREEWTAAAISCLTGEQGPEAREMVHQIAKRCGVTIPPENRQ